MTEDESGLPPLEPADLDIPAHNLDKRLLHWVVETLQNMDIDPEDREKLAKIWRDEEFKRMADVLVDELRDQLSEPPDTDIVRQTIKRHLDEMERRERRARRRKGGTSE